MTPPTISVLLPVRNGLATLGAAISSVLNQSFDDFELLVLDDGSDDGTPDYVRGLKDPRIRLFQDGVKRGLATRLNQGIDNARGRYLARMDADDISFPTRFAQQVAALDAQPEIDLLGCRAVVFHDDGSIIGLLPYAGSHAQLCARPWRNIPLPHPTWMGRAEWFRRHHYKHPEALRAEDQELLLRSLDSSHFACLDKILLGYRQTSFRLGVTLQGRRSLLTAQIRIFAARKQWGNIAAAALLTGFKSIIDIAAALPHCQHLYFMRMSGAVPPDAAQILRNLLGHPGMATYSTEKAAR
ncbi:MAG: glycosyltransferase family 2 protein [Ferrovibrio sp.]|uniref:glycosyltransferase family 2 protein n=1 Tax=Ferrovibrio sp. TaxID=1917215 RepID=UPI00391D3BAF